MRSNILNFICANNWLMYQPALDAMIDIVAKVIDDPVAIAKAFHGTYYEKYLTEDNQPKLGGFTIGREYFDLDNTYTAKLTGNVALIPVIGPVFPRRSSVPTSYGAHTSLDRFSHDFNMALDNPNVDTIINVFDTPGGEVTGVSETADMIFEANAKKTIVSYVAGMNASAGYFLSSAASEIVAADTTEHGSIGVATSFLDSSEYDAKRGLKHVQLVSDLSPNKRPNLSSDEGKAMIIERLNEAAQVFLDSVAKHRGTNFEDVFQNYGKGKMYSARQALEKGMIDKISTLDKLINEHKRSTNQSIDEGIYMTKEELQAKNAELYTQIVADAQKDMVKSEDVSQIIAKAIEDNKKKEAEEKERKLFEKWKASNEKLNESVENIGLSEKTETSDEQLKKHITKVAVEAMNNARQF